MSQTIFIDSTPEIDTIWKRVHRRNDIAIDVNMGPVDSKAIPDLLAGYDTCIVDATYFNETTLKMCTSLKHIVFLGTGSASFIDLAAADKLKITVSTIKGYGDRAVAEHALALVFAAARQITAMDRKVRAKGWAPMLGVQLKDKTIGLIGLGGIGCEMAQIAQGVNLNVVAWNRSPKPNAPAVLTSIDDLLMRSDVISLHLALNDQTRNFLNMSRLTKTKEGVIIVNTARAGVVDETAVISLLKSGHIAHYATDVFSEEPPSAQDPLLALENVTLSSHAGYNTPEAAMVMYRRAIDLAAAGV